MPKRIRSSVIVIDQNQILGFEAEDPVSGKRYFFLPGGSIDEGETSAEAARRECLEETGVEIRIFESSVWQERYDFDWKGFINDCQTDFFLGEPAKAGEQERKRSVGFVEPNVSYHKGSAWKSLREVDHLFSYQSSILRAVKRFSGSWVESIGGLEVYRDRYVQASDVSALYDNAGLKRPTENLSRIAEMCANSNLQLSVWDGNELVGFCRCLTDFAYATYVSDLAVERRHQRQGLGRRLLDLVRFLVGPRSMVLLLSAPEAMDYYPKLNMLPVKNGFLWKRGE